MLFICLFDLRLFGTSLFPYPLGTWGRAAVCDCYTTWTFLLPFFFLFSIVQGFSAITRSLCFISSNLMHPTFS